MNPFIAITAVVIIAGIFVYFIVKEIIKTYKNKPYDPEDKDKL